MLRTVMLVPRRADGGRRDLLWTWVKARWQAEHPDIAVVEGAHNGKQPFNRSLAINRAATKAGDWDVAVIGDADSFVAPEQLTAAVERCAQTGQMTLAYDRFAYLSHAMSDRILAGYDGNWWPGVEFAVTGTCSSMVVVTRKVWDEAEGFDVGLDGWGCEDVIASHKFQTFGDGLQRIPGEVWHLHHPTATHENIGRNVERADLYAAASYDKAKMRALIERLRAELTQVGNQGPELVTFKGGERVIKP